jgi:hypothetical protein
MQNPTPAADSGTPETISKLSRCHRHFVEIAGLTEAAMFLLNEMDLDPKANGVEAFLGVMYPLERLVKELGLDMADVVVELGGT